MTDKKDEVDVKETEKLAEKKVTKKVAKKTTKKVAKAVDEPKKETPKKETFEQWWSKHFNEHTNMITLLLKHFGRAYRVDTLRKQYGISLNHKELAEKVWNEFNS